MTNPQSTPEAVVWVAIDVAKDQHEALIEAPGWKSRKKFRVQNTAEEFRAFADFLHGLGSPVCIGFEPTGNYHRPLAYFLHSEGFQLELISSLALARTREAMHNSWDKNDPKDAQVILHLLKSRLTQHYHDPLVHNLNDLQELSKTHHQVSLEKTRTQHRLLTHYLPLYFPEIARYHSSARSEWLWNLLIEFPTPQSMTRLSKTEFVRRAWTLVGRKVAKERILTDIYLTAQASVGLPVEENSETVDMLRFVLRQLVTLCQLRDTIERRADALLGENADYQRLHSWDRADRGSDYSGRSRRPAAVFASPAVPEVLRARSRHRTVWTVPWPLATFETRQCATPRRLLDGRQCGRAHARKQFPGQVRALHAKRSRQCGS